MTKIAAVSDCHGMLEAKHLPPADVLIVAGDYCPNFTGNAQTDAAMQLHWLQEQFVPMLNSLPIKKIVIVSGNHDWVHYFPHTSYEARKVLEKFTYLQDSSADLDGLTVYGSPWQPWFYNWAFNFPNPVDDPYRAAASAKRCWGSIPDNLDILVTHGPPAGRLDRTYSGDDVGCAHLRNRVDEVKPRLHVFGHIHRSYGTLVDGRTTFVNAALCDENYEPTQSVQVVDL